MAKKLPEQALRVIVLFVTIGVVLFLVRLFIIPPVLKDTDLQKELATAREADREIKYAGAQVCSDCHEKQRNLKRSGYHRDLSCESCHGAAAKHTEKPMEIKPSSPKKRDYCSYCHSYDASRPTGFPQINPQTHNPLKPCITCHNPHNPVPPKTPRSCAACHTQIERTKVASYHALIECTVCHTTPEKHKIAPRTVSPTKPEKREFCGKCHDKDKAKKGIPAVDMATHGEKYVCWQCHYPHMLGGI